MGGSHGPFDEADRAFKITDGHRFLPGPARKLSSGATAQKELEDEQEAYGVER